MNMTPEIVGWIITGIIALFILMGYFVGLIRGWNKSFYRFLWILIIGVVLLFVTPYISRGLFDLDLSFLNLQISNGVMLTTISDAVKNALQSNAEIADLIKNNPDLLAMLLQMASLILNSILFVLLFWILKVISLPFFWIFSRSKKKKQKKEKVLAENLKLAQKQSIASENTNFVIPEKPVKKRHALGSLMGIITGCFIAVCTLMPIIGVIGLVNDLNSIQIQKADGTTTSLVQTYLPAETLSYLEGYNNSVGNKILTYTGMNFVGKTTFNLLTTTKLNDYSFSLTNELQNYASIYSKIEKYVKMDFSTITQAQLDTMITDAKYVANGLFDSGLISAVGSDLLPYFLNKVASDANFSPTEIADINVALKNMMGELANVDITKYKEDLLNFVNIAELLNNKGLILKVINKTITDPVQVFDYVDETLFNDFFKLVLNFNILKTTLPVAFESALDYIADEFNIVVNYENVEFNEETRDELAKIFSSAYGVALTMDFETTNPLEMVTKNTVKKIGVLLDSIKDFNYITPSYANLMAKAKEIAGDKVEQLNFDASLQNYALEVLNSIFNTTSWTTAFEKLSVVFEKGIALYDAYNTNGLSKELVLNNLENIGEIFDKLQESGLFGSIKKGISAGLDYANSNFGSTITSMGLTQAQLNNLIDYFKAGINNVSSWKTEFLAVKPVVQEVLTFVDAGGNITDKLANTDFLINIGRKIDSYFATGKLLDKTLVGTILNNGKGILLNMLPATINSTEIDEILVAFATNSNATVSWENELTSIKKIVVLVKNVMAESDMLSAIKTKTYLSDFGKIIDDAKASSSNLFNDNFMKKVLTFGIGFASENFSSMLPSELNNIFDTIKDNIVNLKNTVWRTEFDAIKTLLSCDFTAINFTTKTGLTTLGTMLDNVKTSQLINNNVIKTIMNDAMTALKNSMADGIMKDALNVISSSLNTATITSWQTELSALGSLLEINFSGFSITNTTGLIEIGQTLDSVKGTKLLNVTNINSILTTLFNSLKSGYVTATTNQNIINLIDNIIAGINLLGNDVEMANYNTEYANEFSALKKVLDNLSTLTGLSDLTLFDANTLGMMFDSVSTSKLVGNSGKNALLLIVDLASNSLTQENGLAQIPSILKNNINTVLADSTQTGPYTLLFNEIKSFANLVTSITNFNIASSDISDLGITLDTIKQLKIAGNNVSKIMSIKILTTLKDSIDETTGSVIEMQAKAQAKDNIQEIINSIENNTNDKTYTQIFADLETLYNNL